MIRDVTGSGLNAAVRSWGGIAAQLPAYALQAGGPGEILDSLGRKMRYFEPEAMATVLCAVSARPWTRSACAAPGTFRHWSPCLGGQAALASWPLRAHGVRTAPGG